MKINEKAYNNIKCALLHSGYSYEEKGLRSGDPKSILTGGSSIRCLDGVRFSGDGLIFNMASCNRDVFDLLSALDGKIDDLLFCESSFRGVVISLKPYLESVFHYKIRLQKGKL